MNNLFTEFIATVQKKNLNLVGVCAKQDGKFLGEARLGPDVPMPLFSLSKSYASIGVGMAIDEGLFTLNDKVAGFFPEFAPGGPKMAAMTVEDLLTMAAGFSDPLPIWHNEQGDWAKAFLAAEPDLTPGTTFIYDSLCTYMLSAIVQKTSGVTLLEFLQKRLFDKMELTPYWETCPTGRTLGGSGLFLRTTEILPFGDLLLGEGCYKGEQLVSRDYVKAATSFKIATPDMEIPDKRMGYGYQFWVGRNGSYRASGAGAQGLVVIPHMNLSIAYHSVNGDLQGILDALWDLVIPKLA